MLFKSVAIIGLGLIGGSLALALKKSGQVEDVIGIDTDGEAICYALANGMIDRGSQELNRCALSAEIFVVATHVGSIVKVIKSLSQFLGQDAVITDTGSVKGSIVRGVEGVIPDHVNFIGGHPIAGTENSGVRYANPNLFSGKRCILTPTDKTSPFVLSRIISLWEAAGCQVFKMSADAHDRVFSLVSHLPHVVAYSLIKSVISSEESETLMDFAGGGLNDYTRVASSSPDMWVDIFFANKKDVLEAIGTFKKSFAKIEYAIERDDVDLLREELVVAAALRQKSSKSD